MKASLFRPCDVATLGLFRLIWGALLIVEAFSRIRHVEGIYSPDYFHFRYLLFEWVPVPSSEGILYLEIGLLVLFGTGVLLGTWFRIATVGYGLIYLHLFFIDEVYYNNHFYLTVLLSFLLAFTNADRAFSIRSYRSRDADHCGIPFVVPAWEYWLVRIQILIVYVYGGIAKINWDWLRAEPLRYWFSMSGSIRFPMNLIADKEWFAWLAAYGGLILDLFCPFLLLWHRTRWFAVALFVSFHLMNSRLFKIGWFPWIGIALLIPFFHPSGARILWGHIQKFVAGVRRIRLPDLSKPVPTRTSQTLIIWLFVAYFAVQTLVPLRHFLWGQRPDWTEAGQKFAWRMMLRNKDSYIKFLFDPPKAEDWLNENPEKRPKIAGDHVDRMADHPWMLLQYARALERTLSENGFPDTEIRVLSVVSLNDRPYQVMIDPRVDLTEADYPYWGVPDWIVPLDREAKQATRPLSKEDRLAAIREALRSYFEKHPEQGIETKEPIEASAIKSPNDSDAGSSR